MPSPTTARMPSAPAELNRRATSATNHCLTGCVIGEVTGMDKNKRFTVKIVSSPRPGV